MALEDRLASLYARRDALYAELGSFTASRASAYNIDGQSVTRRSLIDIQEELKQIEDLIARNEPVSVESVGL